MPHPIVRPHLHRHLLLAAGAGAATVLALAGPPAAEAKTKRGPQLKVMTRNLYLGTDLLKIAAASPLSAFEAATSAGWADVEATNFPERAKLIADEIRTHKPDLIGLQEVALWREGPKNGVLYDATTVKQDFLAILRAELRKRKLSYRVGSVQDEADIEGPTSGATDIRLTMRDALLVRERTGLRVRSKRSANFTTRLTVPTVYAPYTVLRGWTSVDLTLDGAPLRFVNTHLEAYGSDPRTAQARELVAKGGPAISSKPVILVGDFNSDPNGDPKPDGDPKAYNVIAKAKFTDTWKQINPRSKGWSCCTDGTVRATTTAGIDHRIDIIWTKPRLVGVRAVNVGTRLSDRSAGGLWPSDHGGTVTTLRLK